MKVHIPAIFKLFISDNPSLKFGTPVVITDISYINMLDKNCCCVEYKGKNGEILTTPCLDINDFIIPKE